MGANFAPSYVNLAMGFWENLHILLNNPFSRNIVFFGRYIDDVIIIWDGSFDVINQFVHYCNNNQYGLSFTFVTDPNTLPFLDLKLRHDERTSTIVSKNC